MSRTLAPREVLDPLGALAVAGRRAAEIDLLLTDVVMPRISGRELADRLELEEAGLRVLFMSGYADSAIVHHGVLEEGTAFLATPFVPRQLLKKVRQVLDAPAA